MAAAEPATAAHVWNVARLLSQSAVGFGLVGVLVRWQVMKRRGAPFALDTITASFLTAAGIPAGVFLICCAFVPEWVQYLGNLNLALAAAGLSTLYVAYKGLFAD